MASKSVHLDAIPDHIVSVEDAMGTIDSVTSHVQFPVKECLRSVPAAKNHLKKLPDDARALLTEKNAAVRAYNSRPTEVNRVLMRRLQRAVKQRMQELRAEQI